VDEPGNGFGRVLKRKQMRKRIIKKPIFIQSLIYYNKWKRANPKRPRRIKVNNEEGD